MCMFVNIMTEVGAQRAGLRKNYRSVCGLGGGFGRHGFAKTSERGNVNARKKVFRGAF